MKKKKWAVIRALVLSAIPWSLLAGTIVMPEVEKSDLERRRLANWPILSLSALLDNSFQQGVERYLQDHIPGRKQWLSLTAWLDVYGYGHMTDRGLVTQEESLIKVEDRINTPALEYAARLFASIDQAYLQPAHCPVYVAIVPDKGYFLNKPGIVSMDYETFFEQAAASFNFASQIRIEEQLSLADYYRTDPHWKQEKLLPVAEALARAMGVQIPAYDQKRELSAEFVGQQGQQSILSWKSDTLSVLWKEEMKDWKVVRYDGKGKSEGKLYDEAKLSSADPYSVFLGGAAGLMEIENPHEKNGRELIMFCDSYGLSLAPLLAGGYSEVTLVDLRNLPSWQLKNWITFDGQDVLFLYSTSQLNEAMSFK